MQVLPDVHCSVAIVSVWVPSPSIPLLNKMLPLQPVCISEQ
jgi:hypothetical protein